MSLDELVVVNLVVDARVLALVGVVDGGAALAGDHRQDHPRHRRHHLQ